MMVYVYLIIKYLVLYGGSIDEFLESKYKIVDIVDDEEDIITLFKAVLQENGYHVIGFTNPFLALDYIHKHQAEFDSFLTERETIILSETENLINGEVKSPKATLITPLKPFINMTIMYNTIKSCEDYIFWVDRYFSREGLELLLESVNKDKVKSIKILSLIKATNERLRKSFEKFKEEMKIYNIDCEMRIAKDEVAANIHDRWILSKNSNYNIPSPDIVARGQYSEVKKTENNLPFSNMWKFSLDIISDWNEIEKRIREYQNKRMN